MSKFVKRCIGFVQKETILCIAIALALIFSMIVPPNLSYIAYVDWDTLFLLFSLMAVTKGFQKAGLFLYLGNHLILDDQRDGARPGKCYSLSFFYLLSPAW